MSGFRKFLLRGNLVELAVAVVIGIAFNALVTALVADFITPLIGIFGGTGEFGARTFTIGKSVFLILTQAACRARRTLEKSLTVVFGFVTDTVGEIGPISPTPLTLQERERQSVIVVWLLSCFHSSKRPRGGS